eukprot:TRINITY_DN8189_c0_g1_i2.p1 TRINITY_DN8189_c0_g1~~TRINITY_DN8189_c0_g1_i2.p1  ORF type:complete len:333 (+),score=73.15 TRINITY_DN8189_c0_g1_i2:76-1074(+)
MVGLLELLGVRSRVEKEKGPTAHYGTEHHLDVYGPAALDVRVAQVRREFEEIASTRHAQKMAHQDQESHFVALKNTKQRGIMERHFDIVKVVHARLAKAAAREHEYLYNPHDMVPDKALSFEEWKQRELMGLIARRDKAIEVDSLRPDVNRRTYAGSWTSAVTSLTPSQAFESGAVEPTHWPRRPYYYPVTDFSQFDGPSDKCEEETMLENAYYDAKMDAGSAMTVTGGLFGLGISILKSTSARAANPLPLISSMVMIGYMVDLAIADFRATHMRTDLDDFRVAKYCWFVKNRPDLFQRVTTGVSTDSNTGLWNRSEQGGLGERQSTGVRAS